MTSPTPADLPATAGETTAERPWPVRLLAKRLGDYIDRAPALWVEGQVVQLVRRPGQPTCYLTLRDPDVDMSFQVTVHVRVLDGLAVPLTDGARVVVRARPRLWPKRGSLSLAADDLRPVGRGPQEHVVLVTVVGDGDVDHSGASRPHHVVMPGGRHHLAGQHLLGIGQERRP